MWFCPSLKFDFGLNEKRSRPSKSPCYRRLVKCAKMMKNMRRGIPNIFKEGTKHREGVQEATLRNIEACSALADMTRTSLGPNGMNKMLINHLDKIFVTSDTATLLAEMEVAHPAAKLLTMAAAMQQAEIGDGANFVIIFAGELLRLAEELVDLGLHTSEVIKGYSQSLKRCLEIIDSLVIETFTTADLFDVNKLTRAISAPIATKQFGYEQTIAPLVAKACVSVMPKNPYNFAVDNVRVCKILGGSVQQSEVIAGVVMAHDAVGSVKRVEKAKIAVFTCSLGSADTETKGTVLINNAKELLEFNDSEEKLVEKLIADVANSGCKVIVTGSTVDDIALHYAERHGVMVLKTSSKFELRRLCKATGARPLVQMGPLRPEECGYASVVYVREVGGSKVTVFECGATASTDGDDVGDHVQVSTILLRSSTHHSLNDIERAIDDGINTVRALTRDQRFLAGAGASEIELARRLSREAAQSSGLEQYALDKFALSLEIIPRALAENSGLDALDILSQLYAEHEKTENSRVGVDIEGGSVKDMTVEAHNVIDLLVCKKQSIKLAVDAALTVLRVDSIIMAKQAGGPKMKKGTNWDEDD